MRYVRRRLRDILRELGEEAAAPRVRTRNPAMKYALREVRTIRGMGFPAKIWAPLPRHADSGHIHIVALATYRQVRRLFPPEELIREHGSLETSP